MKTELLWRKVGKSPNGKDTISSGDLFFHKPSGSLIEIFYHDKGILSAMNLDTGASWQPVSVHRKEYTVADLLSPAKFTKDYIFLGTVHNMEAPELDIATL